MRAVLPLLTALGRAAVPRWGAWRLGTGAGTLEHPLIAMGVTACRCPQWTWFSWPFPSDLYSLSFKTNPMCIECFLLRKWKRFVKPPGARDGTSSSGHTSDGFEIMHPVLWWFTCFVTSTAQNPDVCMTRTIGCLEYWFSCCWRVLFFCNWAVNFGKKQFCGVF